MDITRQYKPKPLARAADRDYQDRRWATTLHIRCGYDLAESLPAAGIEGEYVSWADPLCEGPLRLWRTDIERRRDRAIHLGTRYYLSYGELMPTLGIQDTLVDEARHFGEATLWFEHDLFDQIILVYLLRRLRAVVAAGSVSMVTLDRHPSVERFLGLGQLAPDALAALYPKRSPVAIDQAATAERVWQALAATDPEELAALTRAPMPELPYLAPALKRYLAEYPSVDNGLSATEQLALEALANGAESGRAAFPVAQAGEAVPFQGDSMFFSTLRGLSEGRHPLIRRRTAGGPPLPQIRNEPFAEVPIELTRAGEDVLASRSDWFRLNGSARWIGGVYLAGPDPAWRFDPGIGTLVQGR